MRFSHPVFVNLTLAAFCVTTFCGCPADQPIEETAESSSTTDTSNSVDPSAEGDSTLSEKASSTLESAKVAAGSSWDFVSEKTGAGLTVFGKTVGDGKEKVVDTSTAAWVWSKDKSTDGWQWVRENAKGASEWATDSANQMWTVTKKESGEFTLWVKVEAHEGVAWAKTNLPKAWKVTKDEAGEAWVWVGEHKVEMTVAAAVVTIVVASLIASPQVVAVAAVKGAIAGGSKASLVFLVAAWKNRDPKMDLKTMTENLFTNIGTSVLTQSGPQILSSVTADVEAEAG